MNQNHLEILGDITRLGDSIVLGSLSVVLSVYLLMLGYKREPLAIILSFVVPASIIGTLKIAFYTCHTNLWGIVSPSGHAAISIGVLGVSAVILSKICTGLWHTILPAALVLLALVIAISRTILGMHTDGDVVIGGLIGVTVVFAIAKIILGGRKATPHKKIHPLIICLLVMIVLGMFYGIKLPSEQVMSWVAEQIRLNTPVCD